MKIPDVFRIRTFIDGNPVSGILVLIIIKVLHKNDFESIWGPSDEKAELVVTRDQIVASGEIDRREFMMDYGHPEIDFSGFIEIIPCSEQVIINALTAHAGFRGTFSYPAGYEYMLRNALDVLRGHPSGELSLSVDVKLDGCHVATLAVTSRQ